MRHSEPARAINPPSPWNSSFSPQQITSPPWGYTHTHAHAHTHALKNTLSKTKAMISQTHSFTQQPLYKWYLGCQSHFISLLPLFSSASGKINLSQIDNSVDTNK